MQLDTPKCAHTVDRSRPSRTLGAPRDGVFHARSDQTVGRRRSIVVSPLQEMLPELWCDGSCPYNHMAPTYPRTVTTDAPPSIYDTCSDSMTETAVSTPPAAAAALGDGRPRTAGSGHGCASHPLADIARARRGPCPQLASPTPAHRDGGDEPATRDYLRIFGTGDR